MEAEKAHVLPEAFPMNGGDSNYSYTKNSHYQRSATNAAKAVIDEAIAKKLDIKHFSSTSNPLCIADMGCSVGPNTFIAMQNVVENIDLKYRSEGLSSHIPDFQVFFNDHVSNDFNTLFASLPPDRRYFAAGVPGSFHGRLFPKASLHFVYSATALQWLSRVPNELVDRNSPAWNRGKIHFISSPNEVVQAYSTQFAKDMETFLCARAQEIVCGGLMILNIPGVPNGIPHSQSSAGILFDLLGSSLMDMAKMGLVNEAKVDAFNVPVYNPYPQELEGLIERNGSFSIERMEVLTKLMGNVELNAKMFTTHLRAGMEGLIMEHFGNEIMDELFDRFSKKFAESSNLWNAGYPKSNQIIVVLKRRFAD